MNQQPQRPQPSSAIPVPISSPTEARAMAECLMQTMQSLLEVIERETGLVRTGKIREAMALEESKSGLSRRYLGALSQLKGSQSYLKQAAPDMLQALHRHHDTFRAMLQINLTVLATAHAVSEGIVRGVNTELQRRNVPQTYTASGHRATPGPRHITPLAISRSL